MEFMNSNQIPFVLIKVSLIAPSNKVHVYVGDLNYGCYGDTLGDDTDCYTGYTVLCIELLHCQLIECY